MQVLQAHDLVYNSTKEQLWNLPEETYSVIFDDGEIKLTNRQIYRSSFYWRLYKEFPGAPLLKKGCVNGKFTSSTHTAIGSLLIFHIYYNNTVGNCNIWTLAKIFYEITNSIYNDTCRNLSEYVTSTCIYDFIEILNEPSILAAKEKYKEICIETKYAENAVAMGIKQAHDAVSKVLYTDPDHLKYNGIKQLTMAGLVNKGQVIQLIGPRGYVHDIDSTVFPYPIDVGYAEGFTSLYDSAVESRSASRASIMNTDPLEQSEYFNREVQLACSIIMDIVNIEGGCDNYVTVPYVVEADDEELLRGKFHMVDNEPVMIWGNITPLVGKKIELRSITGCGCKDVQTVCTICLGWEALIIPPDTNLGYALSTPLTQKISQTIMSTKHFEGSSISKPIELNAISSKWVRLDPKNTDKLFLSDYALKGRLLLRIDAEYVKQLNQILHIDISELSVDRLSRIPQLGFTHTDKEGNVSGVFDTIHLEVSGTGVHLSSHMLNYLKTNGWDSGKGYIDIKLNNWNPSHPVFITPKKGDNIMIFFNDVRAFIKPRKKVRSKITDFKTRAGAIYELINILRTRLNKENGQEFNIVQVEIIVRAMMMVDYKERKYELPNSTQDFQFVTIQQSLFTRNLASMLAYQEQFTNILSTHWVTSESKTRGLLDPILSS